MPRVLDFAPAGYEVEMTAKAADKLIRGTAELIEQSRTVRRSIPRMLQTHLPASADRYSVTRLQWCTGSA